MTRRVAQTTWCWQRRIFAGAEDSWNEKLTAAGCATPIFIERPNRKLVLVEAFFPSRAPAEKLARQFGGRVRSVAANKWLKPTKTGPTRIGRRLEIFHDDKPPRKSSVPLRLHIPLGIAFGSGEHGTTSMMLRAVMDRPDWSDASVLDLGTGSGVLALAARLLGARKIVATDFDADAVRTARQNEALNFPKPLVKWKCADVKRLRPTARYDLVLANLFSGILVEAAPGIVASVKEGGQLWLSGILHTQQAEVIAAYRRQGMRLQRGVRRGKWVMLQLQHVGS